MTIDVDDVATDADLEGYVLGARRLQTLLPDEWRTLPDSEDDFTKTARIARQLALDTTLKALDRRRPRIYWTQLADVTQLKDAVCYGALEIIYRGAVDHEDSPNVKRAKDYAQKFVDEVQSLQPDLIDEGATASSLSIRISRG